MRTLLAILALSAGCATAPEATPTPAEAKPAAAPPPKALAEAPKLRIPQWEKPTEVTVNLRVIPGEDTFQGDITIAVELAHATDVVWLNGTNLVVDAADVTPAAGAKLDVKARIASKDFIALDLPKEIPAGAASLHLKYHGVQSRKEGAGLFQVHEGDLDYAFTHFEPLDARRAFPCFDEPGFKVPWTTSLTVKAEHMAFGNMPVTATTDEAGGMKRVTFAKTPPLPSYLIALAAGPYERVDAGTWGSKKTPVGIIVPKGKADWAKWAVQSTGPILEQHEAYFGIPYPYEKLDHIAVPLQMGAMENPGLITYGHTLILARPGEDTVNGQRAYASVCAHELAHIWFGDLVTTAWWDDIWLNEAFATWSSGQLLLRWKPEWQQDVGIVQTRNGAAGADSLASARRIRQPIETNDDVVNAFDGITYGKGASVIAMFESYLTPAVFQKGVHRYLTDHANGNATAADFLGALTQEAGKDIATPFSTFLEQAGVPLIDVALQCPKGGKPSVKLSQKRYLPAGSSVTGAQTWQVPVCLRWGSKGKTDGRACTMLTGEAMELPLDGAKACPEWVMPNDGMHGYYRSRLPEKGALVKLFESGGKQLSMPEKIGLLGDLGALVRSADVDVSEALALVPKLVAEDNRHTLGAAAGFIGGLGGDFLPEALRPKYEELVRKTFGPKAKKLGFTVGPKDDDDLRLLRPLMLGMAGREGRDPELRKEALKLANAWLKDRKAVHADVIDTVLSIAIDEGGAGFYDTLLAAAKTETDRRDRVRMIGALSSTRDPALVTRSLPLTLTADFDPRESLSFMWGATGDYRTRPLALAWVKEHFDALVARLPKDAGAGLAYSASGFCDAKTRAESEAFFNGRSTKYTGGPRNLAQALEYVDLCIAYRARQQPVAAAFMEKWKK
jgi:alanyl aminopeptidase